MKESKRKRCETAFKQSHDEGAKEFGGLWLEANNHAVTKVIGLFTTSALEIKALMSIRDSLDATHRTTRLHIAR